jgi:hypothetical protein
MWRNSVYCYPAFLRFTCSVILLIQEAGIDSCSLRVNHKTNIGGNYTVTNIQSSDTRVLLCSTKDGNVFPMTENHHADARVESARLRRMMGSALIADSYGETRWEIYRVWPLFSAKLTTRWMGALANTRGLAVSCLP